MKEKFRQQIEQETERLLTQQDDEAKFQKEHKERFDTEVKKIKKEIKEIEEDLEPLYAEYEKLKAMEERSVELTAEMQAVANIIRPLKAERVKLRCELSRVLQGA